MNKTRTGMIAIAGAIALGGCVASTTPNTDQRMGEAMSILRAQQTLNPDASSNTDPVVGVDGKAAKGALDNYRDSFLRPPAEMGSSISVGGGTGGAR